VWNSKSLSCLLHVSWTNWSECAFSLQLDVEATIQAPAEMAVDQRAEEEIVVVEEKMVLDRVAEAAVEGSELATPTLSGDGSEQDDDEEEVNKSITKKIWDYLIS
jgi:hypothetical protein